MNKKNGFLQELKVNRTLFLMILPAVLYFLIFSYVPMVGVVLAFKRFRYDLGIFGSQWIGLQNFEFFFASGKAWLVTRNTILYNLVNLITTHGLAVIMALVFTELAGKRVKKTIQSLTFLPFFISWVIVSAFAYNLFNYNHGAVNTALGMFGAAPIDIYGTPQYWYFIIPILNAWKWVGYTSIMYISAITGLDPACYEAAAIDGANIFKKIRYITLPGILPTIVILFLLQIGRILRGDFEMFYQLIGNNGLLFNDTDVIDTFVFRSMLNTPDIGMPAAAGLYQSVLCFAIILLVNYAVRKVSDNMSLF